MNGRDYGVRVAGQIDQDDSLLLTYTLSLFFPLLLPPIIYNRIENYLLFLLFFCGYEYKYVLVE